MKKEKCKFCKKSFNYSSSRKRIYCSVKCTQLSLRKRELIKCDYCNKIFEKLISRIKRDNHNYCSHSCRNKAACIKKTNVLKDRNIIRNRIIKLREHKCELCGYNKVVQIHHIDKNSSNNEEDNLILLCPNHHSEIHNKLLQL